MGAASSEVLALAARSPRQDDRHDEEVGTEVSPPPAGEHWIEPLGRNLLDQRQAHDTHERAQK